MFFCLDIPTHRETKKSKLDEYLLKLQLFFNANICQAEEWLDLAKRTVYKQLMLQPVSGINFRIKD